MDKSFQLKKGQLKKREIFVIPLLLLALFCLLLNIYNLFFIQRL